ncbi:hypothetical protein FQA39_LY18702 [Lamprigera yunnana]|nr:hypothetical protein FQA39_LY18702 [Lamprigera yunnana]
MKKNFSLLIILLAFYALHAQKNEINGDPYQKKSEIKVNLIAPLYGAMEVGFERHLNKHSSLGISTFIVYDQTKNEDMNYYISPYYRYYFGKKYASGFFLEGFGMLTSIDGKKMYAADNVTFTEGKDVYDLALGVGLGWKLATKKGLFLKPTQVMESFCSMQTKRITTRKLIKKKLDDYLKETIDVNQIPGSAVAVLKNNQVIYERYFGKSSIQENTEVDENSIFRLYSTTKLITTVAVFQLIEKNKLSLEDKISKYLDNLPKEWREVKIKNLVTHSSGLPDIVKFEDIPYSLEENEKWTRLYKKPIEFEIGDHYSYNQTNYCLLTKIIEKITGSTFEDYILKNQFPDKVIDHIAGIVDEKLVDKKLWAEEEITNVFFKNDYAQAKQTYYSIKNKNPTLNFEDTLLMTAYPLMSSDRLRDAIKVFELNVKEYPKSFNAFDSLAEVASITKLFTGTLMAKAVLDGKINLDDDIRKYITGSYPNLQFNGTPVTIKDLVSLKSGFNKDLPDRNDLKPFGQKLIGREIEKKCFENIDSELLYQELKKNKPDSFNFSDESELNNLGYKLMRSGNIISSIKLFQLYVSQFPNSANPYDSLAEAYFNNKEYTLSEQNYLKSLELNPENTNAKEMLSKNQSNSISKKLIIMKNTDFLTSHNYFIYKYAFCPGVKKFQKKQRRYTSETLD